jgi:type I pantothenate kinase
MSYAISLWTGINLPNLIENILPTRPRADLIIHKRGDHRVDELMLRRL